MCTVHACLNISKPMHKSMSEWIWCWCFQSTRHHEVGEYANWRPWRRGTGKSWLIHVHNALAWDLLQARVLISFSSDWCCCGWIIKDLISCVLHGSRIWQNTQYVLSAGALSCSADNMHSHMLDIVERVSLCLTSCVCTGTYTLYLYLHACTCIATHARMTKLHEHAPPSLTSCMNACMHACITCLCLSRGAMVSHRAYQLNSFALHLGEPQASGRYMAKRMSMYLMMMFGFRVCGLDEFENSCLNSYLFF